jgi:hypothetical protein
MKYLVFTSAGDNTEFYKIWLDKPEAKEFDLWLVYYGDDEKNYEIYKKYCDVIEKREGDKYANLFHMYNKYHHEINKYERFFILDDDIIINTDQINEMFRISKKYDLWVCQPSFIQCEENRIAHHITKQQKDSYLRYTNFIEMGTPLFSRYAFNKIMFFYEPSLLNWGVDYFYIHILGIDKKDKYAVIDHIGVINPWEKTKKNNKREILKIWGDKTVMKDRWNEVKNRFNIDDIKKHITYQTISKDPTSE